MGGTRFMVQWEEHPSHLATRLGQLLEHQTLVDVTLMCNTHTLRVHRAVLAACSPYFESILQRQLGMHPLIVLKDMQFSVLKSLIEFMYCGETSVTEDNLGALLQAAKFFQVKGLSAMTKEALGLVPSPKSTVNGDAARKAFVGRSKRVGVQQSFMKSMSTTHATSSHTLSTGTDVQTVPAKPSFQTVSKSVAARPDTQQQTDTAQLLLSLSGSEFPKQTFHTVSKNVRFHHNVSGNAVAVEPSRTLDSSVVKSKDLIERVPLLTPNGGMKPSTSVSHQGGEATGEITAEGAREDVLAPTSQYVADGPRRRGRPVKRQMNLVFQEKVLTDADMALHKEAEASRKALEMLRHQMSTDALESTAGASPSSASNLVQAGGTTTIDQLRKFPLKQPAANNLKVQTQPVTIQTSTISATSRTLTQTQALGNPVTLKKTSMNSNIVYKTIGNTLLDSNSKRNVNQTLSTPIPSANIASTPVSVPIATDDLSSNGSNVVYKLEEPEIPEQVYQIADNDTATIPKEQNAEYDGTDETAESEVDLSNNTNIVYQMADTGNSTPGSVMSQYMEVLKEAGLPTDVPILLDSGDGSYMTVTEEVLMNIVNGGVLQCHVTEGNIVTGEGVEYIMQTITEDEMEVTQDVEPEVKVEDTGDAVDTDQTTDMETNAIDGEMMSASTLVGEQEGFQPQGQENDFQSQIEQEGFQPQVEQEGFQPQVEQEGYQAQVEQEGFQPEVKQEGFQPEVEQEGFQPQVEQEGYQAQVGQEGYQTQVEQEGYQTQVEQEGYQPQIEQEGYQTQVEQEGFQPQVEQEGYQAQVELEGFQDTPHVEQEDYQPKFEQKDLQPHIEQGDLQSQVQQADCQPQVEQEPQSEQEESKTQVEPSDSEPEGEGNFQPESVGQHIVTPCMGLPCLDEDEEDEVIPPIQRITNARISSVMNTENKPLVTVPKEKTDRQIDGYYVSESETVSMTKCEAMDMGDETADIAKGEAADIAEGEEADIVDMGDETADIVKGEAADIAEGEEAMDVSEGEAIEVAEDLATVITENEATDIAEGESVTADSGITVEPGRSDACSSDEIITGDRYGETAMEGFPVMDRDTPSKQEVYTASKCNVDRGFIFTEESSSSEAIKKTEKDCVQDDNSEPKVVRSGNSEMSVEQALQAMMGEGSDTELEVCSHMDSVETPKHGTVVSQHQVVLKASVEERSPDEETEELRLVLSPEDDSVKLVDENPSADESINSFTLVLSPGSSGNDKSGLGEEELLNSATGENVPIEQDTQSSKHRDLAPEKASSVAEEQSSAERKSVAVVITDETDNDVEKGLAKTDVAAEQHREEESDSAGNVGTQESVLDNEQTSLSNEVELPKDEEASNREDVLVEHNAMDAEDIKAKVGEDNFELASDLSSESGEDDSISLEQHKLKGAVVSPSKDIPYAVGLLPLKTALEKFQSMPEYHPRKTRSFSTGKELGPDVPAARVKRKALSSDGPDKKLKTGLETEDDMDLSDNPVDDTAAPVGQEWPPMETSAQDVKEDVLCSTQELVTKPMEG